METWNVCCLTNGLVGACPVRAAGVAQSASNGSAPKECDLDGGPRRAKLLLVGGGPMTEPALINGGRAGLGGIRGGVFADVTVVGILLILLLAAVDAVGEVQLLETAEFVFDAAVDNDTDDGRILMADGWLPAAT